MPVEKERMLVVCETCDARTSATVEGEYSVFLDGPDYSLRFVMLQCEHCSQPILISQDNEDAQWGPPEERDIDPWSKPARLYPPQNSGRELGSAVPESIQKAFSEARQCFDTAKAYTACAIMCRKVLEGICESKSAKPGSLNTRLKDLFDNGELDKSLFEWVTALRLAGNEAAHDVKVTVSREDASDLLEFTEAVAEYLYTFKEKFAAFQNRRLSSKSTKRDSEDSEE